MCLLLVGASCRTSAALDRAGSSVFSGVRPLERDLVGEAVARSRPASELRVRRLN